MCQEPTCKNATDDVWIEGSGGQTKDLCTVGFRDHHGGNLPIMNRYIYIYIYVHTNYGPLTVSALTLYPYE